jgi:nicotinamidase-related amidase
MNQALLVVDIQNDYFPGGAMELVGSNEASAQARKLIDHFRAKSNPVIHIQHVATEPDATFFLPNTRGVKIHESVIPTSNEILFTKHHPNSFLETPLLGHLKLHEIGQLVIVGMMTHMCIDTTTRAAADLGFECLLAHDACATKALTFNGVSVSAENVQASFLAAIDGTFAQVLATNQLMAV